jgi:hypothetical protein
VTTLTNLVIWWLGDLVIDGGASKCAGAGRTAAGPRSETSVAASGSVVFRHWQLDAGVAGWCIGHCAVPVWTQVQLIGSAAWDAPPNSDSGAAVSTES